MDEDIGSDKGKMWMMADFINDLEDGRTYVFEDMEFSCWIALLYDEKNQRFFTVDPPEFDEDSPAVQKSQRRLWMEEVLVPRDDCQHNYASVKDVMTMIDIYQLDIIPGKWI
jgi:hypothetical protein